MSPVSYAVAVAAGIDLRFGLFAATLAVGALLGIIGGRRIADDVVIGTTFAWILGLGVLFVSRYNAAGRGTTGSLTTSVLFGSIFGISTHATVCAVTIAAALLAVLVISGRPLLFGTIDPVVAAARGVPVRLLNTVFLIIVAGAAAEITQVVGAILLLGLPPLPPGPPTSSPPAPGQRPRSPW